MPIIKHIETETVSIKTKIPESLDTEIKAYMKTFQVEDIGQFVQQAVKYVLSTDPDWKKHKKITS